MSVKKVLKSVEDRMSDLNKRYILYLKSGDLGEARLISARMSELRIVKESLEK